ncbi:MAG: chemotaxis protein CheB [Betaproteobacteria bacterium]
MNDEPPEQPRNDVAGQETAPRASFPVVGIGASAGGLEAFTQLIKHLPSDSGMAFVLVQHLDPQHESALTTLLSRATNIPVHEVTNDMQVIPDHIYVIPPNVSMTIAGGVLKLQPRKPGRTPLRSVDSFFESLAQDQGERAIGVILSGSGTDGTLGLEAIKAEAGITFAQDDTSRFDSMPKSAVAAGCVDFVLPPEQIAQELARIAKHPLIAGRAPAMAGSEDDRAQATEHVGDPTALPSGGHGTPDTGSGRMHGEAAGRAENPAREGEIGFRKIMLLLRKHSGVDFSLYKSTTIRRRINRRMVLEKHDTLEGYANFLRGNVKELNALYSDVLISVTSFFRNPEAFEVLEQKIFPEFLQRAGDDSLRIWVLGCSTGQEAYSMAMTFIEASEKASRMRKLQVFATDLNEELLDKARHGLYARSLAQDISPERLRRFFIEEEGGFRINKALREMVVFARHNLVSDPPFSRIDLISCRNLLIYLEPSLQKKAIPTFHYALKPDGILFLGASESIGTFTELFEPVEKKLRIYSRKAALTPIFERATGNGAAGRGKAVPRIRGPDMGTRVGAAGIGGENNAQREADRVIVNRFAPPGVVVNTALQIVQFRGATGAYLEAPSGNATIDVLKMAREGLMLPLRSALAEAGKANQSVRVEKVGIRQDEGKRLVNFEVIPLRNLPEPCYLILFEEAAADRSNASAKSASARPAARPKHEVAGEAVRRLAELERELEETREYLQVIQEQGEASNEELQASNEEVQSANEELQSVNEELETSKEELESTNEELVTVNEEMSSRNVELSRLNSDLVNVQNSSRLALVVLARDLTIRRFNTQAEKQFQLHAADLGRPIASIRHSMMFDAAGSVSRGRDDFDSAARRARSSRPGAPAATGQHAPEPVTETTLEAVAAEVVANGQEFEHEVRDRSGHWYSILVRPYFTLDHKIDGAVIVLVDIDVLKRSEAQIAMGRDYAEAIIRTTRDPLLILNADLRLDTANPAFYDMFNVSPEQSEGRLVYDLVDRQWDIPELRRLLEEILPRQSHFLDFEVTHDFAGIGRRTMLLSARTLRDETDAPSRILLNLQDITQIHQLQAASSESAEKFRLLFERSPLPKWAVDLETVRFVDVNAAAVVQYGYSREEFLRMNMLDIRAPEAAAALQRALAEPPNRPSEHEHTRHRRKNGEVFDVEIRGSELLLDSRRTWLATNTDVTERLRLENNLLQVAADLAEADRRKNEFLALLAHELRGPLAPLSNMLEIINLSGGRGETLRKARETMERQLGQMTRLIDDLLDVSRISQGKLNLRRSQVELASVMHQAVEATRPALDAAQHEFTLTLPPHPVYLQADSMRLAQVFGNLLSNAAKFSEPQGRITVNVTQQRDEVVVAVKDTGIGIPPDNLASIFEMFTQVDRSLERRRGGLGIGLALVRQLVEMHGGSIEGFSEGLGRGSEFVVRLPGVIDNPEPRPVVAPAATELSQISGRRILVVDDNPDSAESLAMLLQLTGNETRIAHDGIEAVAAAAEFLPEVVLLDIGMPGMNGYDAARAIREQPWGRRMMLVAMTGWGQPEDRKRSKDAGFNTHLVKPVDFAALSKLLAEVQPLSE